MSLLRQPVSRSSTSLKKMISPLGLITRKPSENSSNTFRITSEKIVAGSLSLALSISGIYDSNRQ
jgi:hypothetical protein